MVALADWRRRRRGKALRNALFVVTAKEFGMQGRILHVQQHPFECVTNYAGATAFRSTLGVQGLRRVNNEESWLGADECLPHLGGRPDWGYMNSYELNTGRDYAVRRPLPLQELAWEDGVSVEEWRDLVFGLSSGAVW